MTREEHVLLREAARAAGGGVYPLDDRPGQYPGMICIPSAPPGWCTVALMEKDKQHFPSKVIRDVVDYMALLEGYDSRRTLWRLLDRVGIEKGVYVVATSMRRLVSEDDLMRGPLSRDSARMRDATHVVTHAYDDTIVFARGAVQDTVGELQSLLQKELAVPTKLYRQDVAPSNLVASLDEMVTALEKNLRWHMEDTRSRVKTHDVSGERAYVEAVMRWDPIKELRKRYGK